MNTVPRSAPSSGVSVRPDTSCAALRPHVEQLIADTCAFYQFDPAIERDAIHLLLRAQVLHLVNGTFDDWAAKHPAPPPIQRPQLRVLQGEGAS